MKLYRNSLYSQLDPNQTSPQALKDQLIADVYPNKRQWTKMLEIAVLVLGVGFALSGIVFFFAYNWADMTPPFKLTLLLTLIITAVAAALYAGKRQLIRQVALLVASVLVGCLFAVFGQVYQTGADVYTLFLSWTVAILPWTIISVFPPLWMLFVILMNTTALLFIDQVFLPDKGNIVCSTMLIINCLCVALVAYLKNRGVLSAVNADWFLLVITCVVITVATAALSYFSITGIEESTQLITLVVCVAVTGAGLLYGFFCKSLLYIAITLFGVIIIGLCLLFRIDIADTAAMILLLLTYMLLTVSVLIYGLVKLKAHWDDGEE